MFQGREYRVQPFHKIVEKRKNNANFDIFLSFLEIFQKNSEPIAAILYLPEDLIQGLIFLKNRLK